MSEQATAVVEKTETVASSEGASDPFESARLPGNEDEAGAVASDTGVVEAENPVEAEPVVEEAETVEPKAETVEGKVEPKTEAKVWAGQFKTPEDLEVAYGHSSAEGKRLSGVLKEQKVASEKSVRELQDKITDLEIMAQVGPEIKEPTEEELEAMGSAKAFKTLQSIAERKGVLAHLKTKAENQKREAAAAKEKLESFISGMEADMPTAKGDGGELLFPDFDALKPEMDYLKEYEPGMAGHKNSPIIAFLAAYGRRALRLANAGKAKTKESAAAAKTKVLAAAVGAGAAGAGGSGHDPVKTKTAPTPGSDDEMNDNLVKAGQRRHVNLLA